MAQGVATSDSDKKPLGELLDISIRDEKTEAGGNFKRIVAYDQEDNYLGSVTYTINDWGIYIDGIKVVERYLRKGVGTTLIDWMARKYGYNNLKWGITIDNGSPFREAMDNRHHALRDDHIKKEGID